MRVNFVSVHIGGITDGFEHIKSVDLILEKLSEIKQLANIPNGSNYAMERMKLTANDSFIKTLYNKKVYIREKDDSLRYLIRTAIELQGYDVQEDIDIESSQQPAIILMDGGENLSELEFLKQIRNSVNFANTKIIVTTTTHNKTEVLDAGADVYLPKPYEISDLIRWIEYFTNNKA